MRLLYNPGDLSLMSGTHMKVEGDNQLHKVLWPAHVCCDMYTWTQIHTYTWIHTHTKETQGLSKCTFSLLTYQKPRKTQSLPTADPRVLTSVARTKYPEVN